MGERYANAFDPFLATPVADTLEITQLTVPSTGADASASILPNSAVTLDGTVYLQNPSNAITTIQFTGFEDAERWLPPNVVSGVDAIPGTRLASATYNISAGDAPSVHIFCQSNASNIVEFIQNNNSGPATNLISLPLG